MSKKEREQRRLAKKRRRTQRAWLFLAIGWIFLIASAFLVFRANQNTEPLAAIEVNGAPSLKMDQEQVDLGDVTLGQTVEVSFRVTNVGDQPLRFSEQPYIEVVEGC